MNLLLINTTCVTMNIFVSTLARGRIVTTMNTFTYYLTLCLVSTVTTVVPIS